MAAPKLLDKRTVTAEVATQKAQQIKEGLALAKKVDVLREAVQAETGNLETFRSETLAQIQQQIDDKVFERDRLEESLIPLRQEYERLLTPPDLTARRREIQQRESSLEQQKVLLAKGQTYLQQAVSLNIQRERENKIESDRVTDERSRTTKELVLAQEERENAQVILTKAHERSSIMNAALELRESEVKEREYIAERKEGAVNSKLRQIEEYEAELANREVALKDGWKELEKTIKELQN